MNVTRSFYQRQRQDDAFNKFYESVVKNAQDLRIGEPMLPRYRRAPLRYDNGSPQYTFTDPRSIYCQKPFESYDLLVQEFNVQRDIKPITTLESLLMKSANGDSSVQELSEMKESINSRTVWCSF